MCDKLHLKCVAMKGALMMFLGVFQKKNETKSQKVVQFNQFYNIGLSMKHQALGKSI